MDNRWTPQNAVVLQQAEREPTEIPEAMAEADDILTPARRPPGRAVHLPASDATTASRSGPAEISTPPS